MRSRRHSRTSRCSPGEVRRSCWRGPRRSGRAISVQLATMAGGQSRILAGSLTRRSAALTWGDWLSSQADSASSIPVTRSVLLTWIYLRSLCSLCELSAVVPRGATATGAVRRGRRLGFALLAGCSFRSPGPQ